VHDHAILLRALAVDVALPVLLLAHIPVFFVSRQSGDKVAVG